MSVGVGSGDWTTLPSGNTASIAIAAIAALKSLPPSGTMGSGSSRRGRRLTVRRRGGVVVDADARLVTAVEAMGPIC